ncbi:MAG TPA: protein kinase [Vicinamibacteria bacterium]|nr:protein kinase [Vicinamibacteria bacterium]
MSLVGRTLAHYRFLEELGSGGMGVVYLARDEKLGRDIAIKVLPPELAASDDRRVRFEREARAVAALNHPNIVTIHSIEEADGVGFITMELVAGRSLRELIESGPLPTSRTIAIARQIGSGLQSAHEAGVLHRDLKPDNVLIGKGDHVKILDFGLAKLFSPTSVDTESATMVRDASSPGMTLGTVGYMSPEQALGKSVGPATDIFALGVILYEMSTGVPPFRGETLAALFDTLLHETPASPSTLRSDLPATLVVVIEKALAKDPSRRFRSAGELVDALSDPDQAVLPKRKQTAASIVVLPFLDLSPEQDQQYFCHGLSEELIGRLAQVSGLRVVARTSAFAFEGKGLDVREVGSRLNVGTALEGSVRKAGARVRVSVQLVDTRDGYQLWSQRFDRELEDVFAIQDEIAERIAEELRAEIAPTAPSKPSLEAYEAYLEGKYALHKWTDAWVEKAIESFELATTLDPAYASAYAALAECYVWLYSGVGILAARDTIPKAKMAIARALELDPGLAETQKVRGLIAMYHDWDRPVAEESFARALSVKPNAADLHVWNAWRLAVLERRYDDALVELHEAERLDPLDLQVKTQLAYVYYFLHDLDRAAEQFLRVVALDPHFAFAHYGLGDTYAQQSRYDEAIAELEESIRLSGRTANHVGVLGYTHGLAGHASTARALLEELTDRQSQGYVSSMWIALVHLGLGDYDELFRWLDQAFDARDGALVLINAAIELDPVRQDPRFRALLEKMGLP